IGLFGLILATLATNLAANVVGPANDFANMAPRLISFRTGAVLTGLIGIGIQPWRLVADPSGYIFKWLVAYSALLGAIGGILIADYYLLRKMRFNLRGLYDPQGPYWYWNGFHIASMVALTAGIAPCIPGFLATIGVIRVSGFWFEIYHSAWFSSFGISCAVYLMITLAGPAKTLPGRSLDRVGED
ncbi:MAG: cytosine permease, partial [Pirellulaceae bacterium]